MEDCSNYFQVFTLALPLIGQRLQKHTHSVAASLQFMDYQEHTCSSSDSGMEIISETNAAADELHSGDKCLHYASVGAS